MYYWRRIKQLELKMINKFKLIRSKLGLTQKSLGEKLGVTQAAVSHWEQDEAYPSIEVSAKLEKLTKKKGIVFKSKHGA